MANELNTQKYVYFDIDEQHPDASINDLLQSVGGLTPLIEESKKLYGWETTLAALLIVMTDAAIESEYPDLAVEALHNVADIIEMQLQSNSQKIPILRH